MPPVRDSSRKCITKSGTCGEQKPPPAVHHWPRGRGNPRDNRIENHSVLNLSCVDGAALKSNLPVGAVPGCHGGLGWHAPRGMSARSSARMASRTAMAGGAIAARSGALYGMNCGGALCRLSSQRGAGPVAQWLEPTAHNGLVGGSSPPGPTIFSDLALKFVAVCAPMFAFGSRYHWPIIGQADSLRTDVRADGFVRDEGSPVQICH